MISTLINTYNESLISLFSRVITIICIFYITAITSRNLDETDFAIWTLFITIINLVPLLNFGLNTGVVNKLTFINSKSYKYEKINNIITSFLLFQVLISIILILTFIVLNSLLEFQNLNDFKKEVQSFELIVILILISIPFQIYSSLLYSFKKINIANISTAFQNFILLLSVLIVSENLVENYILSYSISYLILFLLFYFISFYFLKISFRIKKFKTYITEFKFILFKSLQFWVMSVISNLLNTGQLLFVGLFFGLSNVPAYFLIQKIFSLLNTFHLAFIAPYSVKFTNNAANDSWISSKKIVNVLIFKITIPFFTVAGLLILFFHSELIKIWSDKLIVNYNACIFFLVSCLLLGISNIYSVFFNSHGLFNFQVKFTILYFLIFTVSFLISKNIFAEYSIIFSSIPSSIIILIFYKNYFKKVIEQKIYSI